MAEFTIDTELTRWHEDGELPTRGQVFVFGSNLAGRHGAGAALIANSRYGAVLGHGIGYQGMPPTHCYAIPTKDERLNVLDLATIRRHVRDFIEFAHDRPDLQFFITRVGCGLAGYKNEDIAPMFELAPRERCTFARAWRTILDRA